jgi:hypothetical protein
METKIVLPQCKKENIPVIGGFVITRAEKDLAEIIQAAPDINQAYLDALKVKQETVRIMVRPAEKTGEMKEVTKNMYTTMDGLRPKLNLFEIKLNRAADQLKKPPEAFGLTTLRKHIRSRKAEGVLSSLELLLHEIDANAAALEAKGFTQAIRDEFTTALNSINADNGLQNVKMDERGELTLENKLVISDFWKGISDIMGIGRLLYKDNPVKLKEYTFAVLNRRVGSAGKSDTTPSITSNGTTGILSVTTTNKATGEAIEGVLITVINSDFTDETDEDGEGYIDGIPAGKVSIILVKAGFIDTLLNDIEIKAGEETEQDVEMEAVV